MKLTRQTDYALRILMFCAASGDRISRVQDIARVYNVSQPFIFKLLNRLVKAGIVETVRGRNGGIMLARQADAITVGEVVRLMEDTLSVAECFETEQTDCPLLTTCQLKGAFERAMRAFLSTLDAVTIHDLAKPSAAVTMLLAQIGAANGEKSSTIQNG